MAPNKKKNKPKPSQKSTGPSQEHEDDEMLTDAPANEDQDLETNIPPTRPPSRRPAREVSPTPAPLEGSMSGEANIDDAPAPGRRYSTRATNVDRHPGRDVGLHWRESRRERESAAAKKAEQKAAEEERKRQKVYLAELELTGIHKLAALQAERDAEENEDERYLDASLASGYSRTSLATEGRHSESVLTESHSSSGSEDESESAAVALSQKRPKAKRKTNTERVREKRAKITAQIDEAAASQAKANKGKQPAGKQQAASRASPPTVLPEHPSDTYDPSVYTAAYRAKLAASATAHIPKSGGSSSGTPTPQRRPLSVSTRGTTTPRASALRFRTSTPSNSATPPPARAAAISIRPAQSAPEQHWDDEVDLGLGGFDDEDVTISRDSVIGRPRGRQPELVAVTRVDPEPKVKPKRRRTAKADMDPKKSRSADSIDEWLRDDFDSTILPSVIHHFGAQRDPWKLDSNESLQGSSATTTGSQDDNNNEVPGLIEVLQDLVDYLFPRRHHRVTAKDRVLSVTRQRVMNWRRGFMTRAHNAVKAAVDDWKKANPDATKDDIAMWAKTALHHRRGVAWWEFPKSDQNPKPQGPLMTPFVLKSFAPHFKSISGSILDEVGEPVGALGLACAAVEIAFRCYKTGKYVAPGEEFDAKNAGEGTDGFGEDTIQSMIENTEVWEEFMGRARQHAPRGYQLAKQRSPSRARKRNIFASSSPAPGEESA